MTHTVTIALPGSIIANAQTPQLKTYLAGEIARAMAIFRVDEVVIFSEDPSIVAPTSSARNPDLFLQRIMGYLDTPQYLRKALYPMHSDLRHAGLLNPLDAPHHLRFDEESVFREGVLLSTHTVDIGIGECCHVKGAETLEVGSRVTVKLTSSKVGSKRKRCEGIIVPKSAPRDAGLYWGYDIRMANGLSEVFSKCPYDNQYDIAIGTSDKGDVVNPRTLEIPEFKHLLIVFGGVLGIEECMSKDATLPEDATAPELFDMYLNTCSSQGSRTIRTEEAIPISMAVLHPIILENTKTV